MTKIAKCPHCDQTFFPEPGYAVDSCPACGRTVEVSPAPTDDEVQEAVDMLESEPVSATFRMRKKRRIRMKLVEMGCLRTLLESHAAQAQRIEELEAELASEQRGASQYAQESHKAGVERDALKLAYDRRGQHMARQSQHLHETRLKLRKIEAELAREREDARDIPTIAYLSGVADYRVRAEKAEARVVELECQLAAEKEFRDNDRAVRFALPAQAERNAEIIKQIRAALETLEE